MSDLTARLLLASGALIFAAITTFVLRRRATGPVRIRLASGFEPGTYFFSSTACLDCAPARRTLIDRVGEDGFTELEWEAEPAVFHELGIDAVPATMIVSPAGSARIYPGMPDANVLFP